MSAKLKAAMQSAEAYLSSLPESHGRGRSVSDLQVLLDHAKKTHKESSPELSSLAARMMRHPDADVRKLAASVLSQDETPKADTE